MRAVEDCHRFVARGHVDAASWVYRMISLERDRLTDHFLTTEVIDSPADEVALEALHALNGKERTQLWLHRHDGSHLLVTGPAMGRYALDFSAPDGRYCYAIDPGQPDGSTEVPAGNDQTNIPLTGLIAAPATEAALLEFLHFGVLSVDIIWETLE